MKAHFKVTAKAPRPGGGFNITLAASHDPDAKHAGSTGTVVLIADEKQHGEYEVGTELIAEFRAA